jgi:polar amino acid transport system substrate-binding protein
MCFMALRLFDPRRVRRQNPPVPRTFLIAAAFLAASCAMTPTVPDSLKAEAAPGGVLRAGINLGNLTVVQKDDGGGDLRGVGPALARELAARLGARVQFVTYDSAAKMAEAARSGAWDVAFLAVDPQRANDIAFSAPYMQIEASYMVRADSALRKAADVDRKGIRIATNNNAAFDLWMQRNLKHAERVLAYSSGAAVELFMAHRDIDAAAGVRNTLVHYAARNPGYRVMDDNFSAVGQAAGVPHDREATARYLREFIEEMKASGFVARALKESNVSDASVAPPAQ